MSTRYTKRHYEDVAHIFAKYSKGLHDGIIKDFADLFAADNPLTCCGVPIDTPFMFCRSTGKEHHFESGFNAKRFLAACGLESEE